MNTRVFVPRDSTALSLGADEVAAAIEAYSASHDMRVEVIRNGSRGLCYLEPMVEVEVEGVRHAYGPVSPGDVAGLFAAGFLEAKPHALALDVTEDID